MTEPEPLRQIDRTYVRLGTQRLSYFSGCDYYRLSSDPRVIAALISGVRKFGLNVAASRMTTGNHRVYQELELKLARFFSAPKALLVSNGYAANLIAAQALAGQFSHALLDSRAHASLVDAAGFLDCPLLRFPHRDPAELARAVQRCGPQARLIVLTDGVFAHDGSLAPLKEYLSRLPRDARMLVDDAHGVGVVGPMGRGSLEATGTSRRQIIQTITLSKAFGVYGGAILGSDELRQKILERSRLFIGSTPPPLPLAYAAGRSLALFQLTPSLRTRLRANTQYVRLGLRNAGIQVTDNPGPIVGLIPTTQPLQLRRALLRAGIYPPFIKYPGGPPNGYFRFVLSSAHRREQLDQLLGVLVKQARHCQLGPL